MATTINQIERTTIRHYIELHIAWSKKTFGVGGHLEGLLRHIEKEVDEVRKAETPVERLNELVDIVILSCDAMWREGFTPEEITSALIRKQQLNSTRRYPKITDPNQPTEHIRGGENG